MSFFDELKRRKVVRVGIAYVVIGWVLAQVAELLLGAFEAPAWVLKSFLVVLALGFPVALILAWAYQVTPEGVTRDTGADDDSAPPINGLRTDRIIMAVMAVIVGLLLLTIFHSNDEPASDAVATAGPQSIAVLPFVNLSDDDDYFADGLSEELMNLLAKIPDLKVAGRTSSFQFKGRTDDLREIGSALGVHHVLEGSVRRSGNTLRVTAQLNSVADGFNLWSQTYQRAMADIFEIQDDVAGAISRELKLHLVQDAGRPTDNTEAYALYLEALPYIANNDHPNLIEIVIDLLDRAIELDPGFAKAHEAKAQTYWILGGEELDSEESRRLFYESALAALELDDSLVLARYYVASGDPAGTWDDGMRAGQDAIAAEPGNFGIVRAWCVDLIQTGYFRETVECTGRMIELEPLSPVGHWRSGNALGTLGQREDARRRYSRAAVLGGSDYALALVIDAVISSDFDQAAALALNAPNEYSWQPADVAQVAQWTGSGNDAAIVNWIEQMVAAAPDFYQRNNAYYWYLALGHMDEYWNAINSVQAEAVGAWDNSGYLLEYGFAFGAREFMRHPGYLRGAESSGHFEIWDRRGAPDFCSKDTGEWVCE